MPTTTQKRPLLEVRNLSTRIGASHGTITVGRDISYELNPGETLAIVGESGSGKSVNTMALVGLQPKRATVTADKLAFEGRDLLTLPRDQMRTIRGNEISVIFQDPMTSLNPVLTVGEQLIEVYLAHGLGTRAEAEERAIYLLERVGMRNAAARMRQYPHQLSGGLRQRVVIAIAMMCKPKLIIADEPTTALDVTVQALILSLLRELQDEFKMALILITHDFGVVASIADRVLVLYAGGVVESGPAKDVIANPAHPYTSGLLNCIPRMEDDDRGQPLNTIPGMVPSLAGNLHGCLFRNRCALAEPACASDPIPEVAVGAGRMARCIHADAILAETRAQEGGQ
ncbi:ABC transporter ATP-binding protein [Sinisalibacter aestuarii]|uniref:Peptide ABC transporter ATP-binding protein n=1 Tax=Sinisalibacter aestuarii TaxID=2949426 RepID=A0ABQ5LY87_9RHOB|nr:ABC transporter ATP-binding protein [Sinisalibacter aestuarii]GKY89939.1 peptide ABC transporter ATP-binding protein [Sinisalibacter aestuarii]